MPALLLSPGLGTAMDHCQPRWPGWMQRCSHAVPAAPSFPSLGHCSDKVGMEHRQRLAGKLEMPLAAAFSRSNSANLSGCRSKSRPAPLQRIPQGCVGRQGRGKQHSADSSHWNTTENTLQVKPFCGTDHLRTGTAHLGRGSFQREGP